MKGPDLFPGVVFGQALSLGANCETAHFLRLHGRHDRGLFDWLVTPLDAIGRVLADDGARLGTEFIAVQDGTSVRCGVYGALYHHEFVRDEDHSVRFDIASIERCRSKLLHKWRRFVDACEGDEPILFIRFAGRSDLPWDRIDPARASLEVADLDRLAASLGTRFPRLAFRILLVLPSPTEDLAGSLDDLDRRVRVERMETVAEGPWRTENRDWTALLARVRFRTEPTFDVLGETLHWSGEMDEARTEAGLTNPGHIAEDGPTTIPSHGAFVRSGMPDGVAEQIADELHRHDFDRALHHLDAAVGFGCEAPEEAVRIGRGLWNIHASHQATFAFAIAFEAGVREPTFLRDHLGLLSGETRYADVLAASMRLAMVNGRQQSHVAMLAGHARLALAHDRPSEINAAERREASARWVDTAAVLALVKVHLSERRPFSLIRLGDGEARFLIAARRDLSPEISDAEAGAIGASIWGNWFGGVWSDVDPDAVARLATTYENAVAHADVVGASAAKRMREDTGHYGYLAVQERWLRQIGSANDGMRWTSAFVHQDLHRASPFLATLLEGRDFLGTISPHPGLAEALRARFSIRQVAEYVIPGEGRLPDGAQNRGTDPHFPSVYEAILADLVVPGPGCLFIVAGGLLGKIYCARIKELGGVALDVGAIVDAWMGYDTRPGQLVDVGALSDAGATLVAADDPAPSPPPATPTSAEAAPTRTIACLSIGKTSSMALAAALRDAGCADVGHLHYLGPQALALKRRDPEPMLELAESVAARIGDPRHHFTFVTCVRDPIARALSQAFYNASRHRDLTGEDIVRDVDSVVAWQERKFAGELSTLWFDDTFKATFGFDFRSVPFDHDRRSLRHEASGLKLVVLRQEDPSAPKERELGWLLGLDSVTLPVVNDGASQGYEAEYCAFIDRFVAPPRWLDTFYETDVARHFYTPEERAAFRRRWSVPLSR